MHTIQINVFAKKGDVQLTRWLIQQTTPYPRIGSDGGRLRWENDDGCLWDRYQQPAKGIQPVYYCYLLASNAPLEIPADWNREILAGYKALRSAACPNPVANPGTITYRGQDLGEIQIRIEPNYVPIYIHDSCTRAHGSEYKFLQEQVVPNLKAFISEHAATLKAEAVAKLQKRLSQEVSDKRREIDAVAALIETAKF